jgi:prepilin-type N-terminal cleavage/methylation domain-containing protein
MAADGLPTRCTHTNRSIAPATACSGPTVSQAGFSLVELAIVLVVAGLLLAMTAPGFQSFRQTADLKSAADQIGDRLMVTRQKAIATGTTQEIRFIKDFAGTSDYHIWNPGVANPSWRLPKDIDYYWGTGTKSDYHMTSDGRCVESGFIILQNPRGMRDTISIRVSGMVFVY